MPTNRATFRSPTPRLTLLVVGVLSACSAAHAQLREPEVLVIYDSRISDSRLVAEHYAGSAKVPGGLGGVAGAHPSVLTLDLSTLAAVGSAGPAGFSAVTPDISYSNFDTQLRGPLRAYLTAQNLTRRVRSIVTTRGLPHRIQSIANPTIGDNPGMVGNSLCDGQLTYASVDIELALLWQSFDAGENGAQGSSYSEGWMMNPFWRQTVPQAGWPRSYITTSPETLTVPTDNVGCTSNAGVWWNIAQPISPSTPTSLTPGDMYMVCRIDGNSVALANAIVDRAQNLVLNTSTSAFVFNSSTDYPYALEGGGGLPEFDNGPDYYQTSNLLTSDGRFVASNVTFIAGTGLSNFIVGPNISFAPNTPTVISSPILLLASYGANFDGYSAGGVPSPMNTTYANSFNYAPGAVFNTIESYNGRAFGGNGQNIYAPQQQAADALANGCTFAVCNVWEPTTITIADNYFIVQNFFLGNLSWAEAAYSALPAISWSQMVVGDPLARVRRDSEDINGDGKLTIDDLYAWYASPKDLNHDGSANATDYSLLEAAVRGPELVNMKGDQR